MNLQTIEKRTHCIRCGECCLKSSPTLQKEDVPLVTGGRIEKRHLYTIRPGELVVDPVEGGLKITELEIIKVRENKERGGCIFYQEEEKACGIYEDRPVQCVALACWDPEDFFEVYSRPRAQRTDLVEDSTLLGLIEAHEERCGYDRLKALVRDIEKEKDAAVEKILDMLKFDHAMRPFLVKKLDLNPEHIDLMFGRPLIGTIQMFGLRVVRQPDGTFFLTVMDGYSRVREKEEGAAPK